MQQPKELILPDLIAICPFSLRVNPFYKQVRAESAEWIMSFNAFCGHKREHFVASDFEMLAAYAHPDASHGQLRLCGDLINHLATMDMMCDDLDSKDVREVGDQYMAALTHAAIDNGIVSRMVSDYRDLWDQYVPADSNNTRHHVEHNRWYFIRLTKEAELRDHKEPFELSLDAFMQFRRENSAMYQSFDLIEMCHAIDLPDEVTEDKVFEQIYFAGLDLCWLTNDIVSFTMEQSYGLEEANMITFLQRTGDMSLQDAADYSGVIFRELLDKFIQGQKAIRSFGADVDRDVKIYIKGVEEWIIGNIHWSFDCQRYFGKKGQEVKKSRVTKLGPVELA